MKEKDMPGWLATLWNVDPRIAELAEKEIARLMEYDKKKKDDSSFSTLITVNGSDVEIDVEYEYQPWEPAERGPEAQYPGCPESFTLSRVYLGGYDISDAVEALGLWEDVEEELYESKMREKESNREY